MADYLAQAEAICGKPPVGDPEEMRRYARVLRTRAEVYADTAQALRSAVEAGGLIEGRFARRAERAARRIAIQVETREAPAVMSLAEYLEREAAKLHEEQEAKEREIRKKVDELVQADLERQEQGRNP